jgi:hypothetical protein
MLRCLVYLLEHSGQAPLHGCIEFAEEVPDSVVELISGRWKDLDLSQEIGELDLVKFCGRSTGLERLKLHYPGHRLCDILTILEGLFPNLRSLDISHREEENIPLPLDLSPLLQLTSIACSIDSLDRFLDMVALAPNLRHASLEIATDNYVLPIHTQPISTPLQSLQVYIDSMRHLSYFADLLRLLTTKSLATIRLQCTDPDWFILNAVLVTQLVSLIERSSCVSTLTSISIDSLWRGMTAEEIVKLLLVLPCLTDLALHEV